VGNKTSTTRSEDETDAALFWSGDIGILLFEFVNQVRREGGGGGEGGERRRREEEGREGEERGVGWGFDVS